MLATNKALDDLRHKLNEYTDDSKLEAKSGVSQIIIRRIRKGIETNVRAMTVDRLNRSLELLMD